MADNSELSKWAGAGIALLAAGGGYIGSLNSNSQAEGALRERVEALGTRLREHDTQERDFERQLANQLSDLEARVRVLESRK